MPLGKDKIHFYFDFSDNLLNLIGIFDTIQSDVFVFELVNEQMS